MSEPKTEYTVRRNMHADRCVIVAIGSGVDNVLPSLLFDLEDYCHLVFISSSPGSKYDEVLDGLSSQGFIDPILLMREYGDYRDDATVKEEIYKDCIKDNWSVHLVFDDHSPSVRMWRSKGLTCYQVGEHGGF